MTFSWSWMPLAVSRRRTLSSCVKAWTPWLTCSVADLATTKITTVWPSSCLPRRWTLFTGKSLCLSVFLSQSLCLPLCLCLCLSLSVSLSLSLCFCLCLSLSVSVTVPPPPSLPLSVSVFVCLSVSVSVSVSLCLFPPPPPPPRLQTLRYTSKRENRRPKAKA